jgi:uncharacterized protein YprB with RNaseH-like and TPR domain
MSSLADRIRSVVNHQSSVVSHPSTDDRRLSTDDCPPALSCLGGEWREGSFLVERRYESQARYGRETVGVISRRLAAAAGEAALVARNPSAAAPFVFFDLETTGLAGGAGTYAFLVGCARFDDDAFLVRQFVLVRHADEPGLLNAVSGELAQAGTLVSFNGKSFDAPLLELRHLFHRRPWTAGALAHLDLLHPARRFWSGDDHSLVALEHRLLGATRLHDVSGFEIPSRYFAFLRSGQAPLLVPVLEHNRLDLLSLAALTARLLELVRLGPAAAATAHEALALGRLYAESGRAFDAYQRALELCAPRDLVTRVESLRSLALLNRRCRQYADAARLWQQLANLPGCPAQVVREANEALAIHHEHRVGDLSQARTFALRSLPAGPPGPSGMSSSSRAARSVHHRLARLDRKLAAAQEDEAAPSFEI